MPSELTSPALLTETPDSSPLLIPLIAKPLAPLRSERFNDELTMIFSCIGSDLGSREPW
ncbi:hypothetical protein [Nostoc sp.]|uniref:hypothetical protein n=1 Tax=Nostoc sp. TaxID=1180 RepID=UPI002FFC4696